MYPYISCLHCFNINMSSKSTLHVHIQMISKTVQDMRNLRIRSRSPSCLVGSWPVLDDEGGKSAELQDLRLPKQKNNNNVAILFWPMTDARKPIT